MWKALCQAFLVTTIAWLITLSFVIVKVSAQSTVADSESCESSTSDEVVSFIKKELKNVRLIREDLKDVKSVCAANQQHLAAVDTTSALCEYSKVK